MSLGQQLNLPVLAASRLEPGVVVERCVQPVLVQVGTDQLAGGAAAEEPADSGTPEQRERLDDVGEHTTAQETGTLPPLELGGHLVVEGMAGQQLLELAGEVDADGAEVAAAGVARHQLVPAEQLDRQAGQERHRVGDGSVEVEHYGLRAGERPGTAEPPG